MKIEQLLYTVADSQRMDGWTDTLSQMIGVTKSRTFPEQDVCMDVLEENVLAKVAGGHDNTPLGTERKI